MWSVKVEIADTIYVKKNYASRFYFPPYFKLHTSQLIHNIKIIFQKISRNFNKKRICK